MPLPRLVKSECGLFLVLAGGLVLAGLLPYAATLCFTALLAIP
jgi:hypothetical protein